MEDLFKVIFQLDADGKGAIDELTKVNAKYVETNETLKKSQTELTKLMAREAELLAGRSKANNPTQVVRYNAEIAKTQEQIKKLNTEVATLTKTEQGATQGAKAFGDQLKQAFDTTKAQGLHNELKKISSENKNLATTSKDAFGALRAELRAAKSELLEAFGSGNQEQINKASQKVGEIKDRMNDLNESTAAFASGSKFQQIGNLFGDIGRNILNLDFGRANEQSKALLATTRSITFAEAGKGIKDLGGTLLNVGKSLLANPLFLLGTALTVIMSFLPDVIEHFGLFTSEVERNTKALAAMKLEMDGVNASIDTQIIKLEANIKKLIAQNAPLKEIIASYKELEKLKFQQVNNEIGLLVQQQEALTASLNKRSNRGSFLLNLLGLSEKEKTETQAKIQEINTKLTELNNQRLQMHIATEESITGVTKANAEKIKKIIDERKKVEEEQFQEAFRRGEVIDKQNADANQKEREDFLAAIEQQNKLDDEAAQQSIKDREHRIETEREFEMKAQDARIAEAHRGLLEREKLEAQEEQARRQRVQQAISDIQTIANATINASNQVLSAKIKEVDKTRSLQEKRVADAKQIADKGNAELLELEQERLDDLNKKRETFVRRQQELATIELIANTAIAVSKAAAQGGAAAGVTIAATLIALVGGLLAARDIASNAAFYEGGYTGEGDPKSESKALGKKNYTYHKGEFVFDHQKTGKYRPIFEDIHKGNIDLNEWKNKVVAYETVKFLNAQGAITANTDLSALEEKLDDVIAAISGQSTSVSLNENGLEMRFRNIRTRNNYIRNHLAKA